MTKLRLAAPGSLPVTGPVDAIESYYKAGIGWVLRQRMRWILGALPEDRYGRILEIGFGSGVLMHELSKRTPRPVGIDVHAAAGTVRGALARDGIPADLVKGDGSRLPFRDRTFDAVILMSVLEFISSPSDCLRECLRVIRDHGRIVCVTPRHLAWADRVYQALAGVDPERDFRGGRRRVQDALAVAPGPIWRFPRPAWLPMRMAPYELVVLQKQESSAHAFVAPAGAPVPIGRERGAGKELVAQAIRFRSSRR